MSFLPDWLTGFDAENAQRAADADAKLRAINQAQIDSGYYSAAQAAQIEKDYSTQATFGVDAQRAEIDTTFVNAIGEQRDKLKGLANSAVWETLKSIPLVVWLGLAVAVFVWLGGLSLLKGKLAK